MSIGWWRTNGVIDYFHRHLGYNYHGTGVRTEPDGSVYGLPENFIYNVGGDKPFLRRLVSTFLSPLASGYLFVVALVLGFRLRRAAVALSVLAAAGLLWTFSRSSLVALAAGLVVLALVRRRPHPARCRGRRDRGRDRLGASLPEDRADRDVHEGRLDVSTVAREGRADGLLAGEHERAVAPRALGWR